MKSAVRSCPESSAFRVAGPPPSPCSPDPTKADLQGPYDSLLENHGLLCHLTEGIGLSIPFDGALTMKALAQASNSPRL